jgi:hypothetical protein
MNCTNTIQIILDKYLQYGWIQLTTIFANETRAKEKIAHRDINERLLRLLGCVRNFVVDKTFECSVSTVSKDSSAQYLAFGSTNITSDYDITVIGQKAPAIMNNMFHRFLDKYQNSLPFIFDTNVYCAGLYGKNKIHRLPQVVNVRGTNFCVIRAKTKKDMNMQLKYAAVGLLESGIENVSNYTKLNCILEEAKLVRKSLENSIQTEIVRNTSKDFEPETKSMIAQYKLTYTHARTLFAILYGKNKTHLRDEIMEYACKTQYFSIESYYTPGAFNVVVMNMQGKHKIGVSKADYVCSLLENLGHFRKHMHYSEALSTSQLLLKNSKYIHRMYYAAGHALGDVDLKKKTKKIEKHIVAYRGNPEKATTLDFSVLGVSPQMTIDAINKKMTTIMLSKIESII